MCFFLMRAVKTQFSNITARVNYSKIVIFTGFLLGSPCLSFASVWAGGSGNWSSDVNPGWNGTGVPNGVGAIASFSGGTAGTTTQDVVGVTLGTIDFSSGNVQRSLTMTNGITLDQDGAGSGVATISNTNANAGSLNRLSIGVGTFTLADNLLISNSGGSTNTSASISISTTFGGTGNMTLSNVSNSLSTAMITITGSNTFTGNVAIQKGAVTIAQNTGMGNAANAVTLGSASNGGATLVSTGTTTSFANNITVAAGAGGTLLLGSTNAGATNSSFTGTIALSGDLNITSSKTGGASVNFTNIISGAGSLTKEGTGIASLSGANTHSGDTIVSAGTLALGGVNALQNSTLDVGSSGSQDVTFTVGGNNTYNLGGLKNADDLAIGGNTLSVGSNNQSTTYSGVLSGASGGLTKVGTGTLILSGASANTNTGATTVSAGILALNKTAGVNAIDNVTTTVSTGGTLRWDASNQVHDTATIVLNGGTLNLNGQSEGMGTLSATANSFINFGSGTAAITFLDSIGTLTANSISISNFTLGTDTLRFGGGAGTVDVSRLIFTDFGGIAGINDGTGFITPNVTQIGSDIFFSNPITGTNAITQNTAGTTMILTGTNTSTGIATVNTGTLSIGTSAGGNWVGNVVANGGILKGIGTISGNITINSGATYSPGNSPGIQVVAGNATVNPGGTLLIEIDGATAGNGAGFYDQTQVGGTATINGGTLQGFTIFSGSTNFVPQFGTKVTFLTASSVTGSFQSYDFSGNGNGVSWMPEYRNTEVNLFAVPADFGNVSGFNSNQNSVGRALQSFRPAAIDARTVAGSSGVTATSDVGKIFNGLMRQDNSGLKTAYDQLSPEKLTAMSATVKQFGSISNSGTNQRLSQIRWGDRGVSLNGITLQTLDGDYENELLAVEKGAILIPKKKFSGKTGFFVNTTGSYSDVDSDERRIGYENRLGGITAGIDQELTKEVTAGFFAGQGYADTKLGGGGGSVEANSGRIGIYGGYHKNGYYLNGSLGAGTTSFDTKRNIGFIGETASGSTQGYDLSGQIVGGVDFQTEEWVWGPIAKLDYGYQWIEKYNERGSAARLNLDSQAGASAETGAGMRVSRPFNYNGWKWIPELRLMGSHQWEKPNDIRAQFAAGGDAFTVHPEGAGQEMIIPGAGLQLRFSETTTLNFGYEARVNLESCSHQLDLGIATRF